MSSSGGKFVPSGLGVPRRRTVIAVAAALLLLPIEVSKASWLSDVFAGSSRHSKSPARVVAPKHAALAKHVSGHTARPKPHDVKLAALGPSNLNLPKPGARACEPSKFRIVLDVGHTAQ